MNDSDEFLFGFCKEKRNSVSEIASLSITQNNASKSVIDEIKVQTFFFLEDLN